MDSRWKQILIVVVIRVFNAVVRRNLISGLETMKTNNSIGIFPVIFVNLKKINNQVKIIISFYLIKQSIQGLP
jgi:hypothetical protein